MQQRYAAVNSAISVPLLDLYTSKRLTFRGDASGPSVRGIDEPSLRFTWEQENPDYYDAGAGGPRAEAVAVIADDEAQPLSDCVAQRLAGCRLLRRFITSENVFGYKTIVKVYLAGHHPRHE